MIKVNNKKILSLLANRTRKANKSKVAIIAIVLTSILFTSIFTIGGSIIKTSEQETMRQVGTSSHGGYKYFTQEEYDTVCKDMKIKDISCSRYLGAVSNKGFEKNYTEVRYSEDKSAKWGFTYPTKGHMPVKDNEIATSTIVLDNLGVPYKLGKEITLQFDVNGDKKEKTFTLCGYWEGDIVSSAQQVLVSKAYSDMVLPTPTIPFYESNNTDSGGYISVDIYFNNNFNIAGKMSALSKRCGFDEKLVSVGINWAYSSSSIDIQTIFMIVVILLIIMLSGYLIIYNIFFINVYRDIQFYGLLKTIGTTGKQIKKIVYRQAFSLCLFGIPLGLVIGWFIGKVLIPITFRGLSFEKYQCTSANPLIFIVSAFFTLFTVWMSCIRPCKIASKVSPIEAVHYTAGNRKDFRRFNKKGEKRTDKITTPRMAFENMKRQKKQTIVVVLSLSLSMILLNSVYACVKGFDMDKYVENEIVSDFSVSDASIVTPSVFNKVFDGVSEDFRTQLKQKKLENLGNIYANPHNYIFDNDTYANLKKHIFENEKYSDYMNRRHTKEAVAQLNENNMLDGYIYGVDNFALSKLTLLEGKIDVKAFNTGKYIVINKFEDGVTESDFFKVGDKVPIEFDNGDSKEYEVMAIVKLPYAISPQMYFTINFETFLPEREFLSQYGERQPMWTFFDVKDGEEAKVEQWLEKYCESSNLSYFSKNTVVKEFEGVKSTYKIVGGALTVVLALIGILNFTNAVITSIIVRKHELAMMEAIGMTGGQLKKMLTAEGIYYAIFTIAIALTLGIPFGYFIVHAIAGQIWFFRWHFTILPIIVCIPFLIFVSYIIPNVAYRQMCKQSVINRMAE